MSSFTRVSEHDVRAYVEANIGAFHARRVERLNSLDLNTLLRRKNPYLFRTKGIQTAQDLVKPMLDAHLSSQEEGLFGTFLEGLAIRVAEIAYGGRKSGIEGVDLEFDKDATRYIVAIKSGPNWGNSSQVRRMRDDFSKATRIMRQGNPNLNVVAVNGCCYGRTSSRFDHGDYLKLSGQMFWQLISDDADFYIQIIEPMGHQARSKNQAFHRDYSGILNILTAKFIGQFCKQDGQIDWRRLVEFNSKSVSSS